jgi:hypothetical protein
MESFSAALLAQRLTATGLAVPSAERRAAWAVAAPDGNRSSPAPPQDHLPLGKSGPAADDCNEPAGSGKDPKIVVMPPRTVLVGDSEASALYEALDELTSSQPPRPTTGLRGLAHTANTGYACADPVPAATLEDAWRMAQGTTTVISGPLRSFPIRRMTSPDSATSIAWPRGP